MEVLGNGFYGSPGSADGCLSPRTDSLSWINTAARTSLGSMSPRPAVLSSQNEGPGSSIKPERSYDSGLYGSGRELYGSGRSIDNNRQTPSWNERAQSWGTMPGLQTSPPPANIPPPNRVSVLSLKKCSMCPNAVLDPAQSCCEVSNLCVRMASESKGGGERERARRKHNYNPYTLYDGWMVGCHPST